MDILTIITQPPANSIIAAYQPVQYVVLADTLVIPTQPMYCDVYYIDVTASPRYYKTLVSYSYTDFGGYSLYRFDIQDALQEYLQPYLIGPEISQITQASDLMRQYNASKFQCFFRGSTYDGAGLLLPNGTIPEQGTAISDPVSGTGTGGTIYVTVNATLRPMDSRVYEIHLEYMKIPPFVPEMEVWPLSNFPRNKTDSTVDVTLAQNQYQDVYASHPIYFKVSYYPAEWSLAPAYYRSVKMELITYTYDGYTMASFNHFFTVAYDFITEGVWYVPVGMRNIIEGDATLKALLFASPYYRVILYDADADGEYGDIWISPLYRVNRAKDDVVSLVFQNFHGCLETINFTRNSEDYKTESTNYYRGIVQPPAISQFSYTDKTTGRRRNNVAAEETITVWGIFTHKQMDWIKELLAAPIAYMQVPDAERALSNRSSGLMPIVIEDASIETKKDEGRYEYMVAVKFKKAFDYRLIRN